MLFFSLFYGLSQSLHVKCSARRSQKGEKDNREGGEGAGMSDFLVNMSTGMEPIISYTFFSHSTIGHTHMTPIKKAEGRLANI